MLLRACPDIEAGHIHELSSNTDVTLTDENTGMVDRLGKSLLVHLSLEATFKELLGGELKNEIELELVLGEETVTIHTTEESCSLEDALGVLRVEGEQSTGGLTKLRQSVLAAPDLALASESILSDKLELGVETFLLEGTTGSLVSLPVVSVLGVGWHG